jgi:nitroreductase
MEFEELVRKRGMVRAFRPDPVPDELIQKLLGNAVRAPSAGNLQPWEFIVVRDDESKRRLAKAALSQMFLAEAPVVIVTCRDVERNAWSYGDRGRHFYSLSDVSCATMMILLTAGNEGLGACWVGAYRDEEVSRILGLPERVRPVALVSVGWPAEESTATERIPLAEVVHYERFGQRR